MKSMLIYDMNTLVSLNIYLDFDQMNLEINQAEKRLKENIKKLYDAEKKPEIRGFNLKSLSREEREEFNQLLEPYI